MPLCERDVCYIQWIVYVPTFVVGLPLNLATLWLLLFRIRRWTESTVYLSSLIINDILLIFSLPFKIYAFGRTWGLSMGFCTFLESLVFVNIYGSIVLIVCISGDRYVSLRFPFNGKRLHSPRKAALVCLAVWVTVFAFTTPVYELHNKNTTSLHNNNETRCFEGFSRETWGKKWIIVAMETVFTISTVTMLFFSVRVMQILSDIRRRNPLDKKVRDNKSVKIVLSNLVAFMLCFIPYHVAAVVYFLAKNGTENPDVINPLRDFVHISTCLGSVNCLTDGVCYYFILKENLLTASQERRRMSTRGNNVAKPGEIDQHLMDNIMVKGPRETGSDNQVTGDR
ncbi:G-protein coupled receptor 55a [Oncorhynchus keta]|uniref:G-protein coupled receptor 55a n=1 Tax=Oncorhynchus keta TaxID=8018 RepID=UPI0015FE6AFF|nr:G-protein coupled receptor 55a [Oncorhynchus keta]XP_035613938.1 G-protein coupled receptor 55a [Oncorhynchus keta]XP_035613939.1 G-protein coupled receptor 55a [Oncorhynchus keta]XP_052323932.1 G-protein coupled receptor 55a [Oncorhynchus keta]XP_052323933.1 G-protein coupled receptor 55a [Oncorhynchus keta]